MIILLDTSNAVCKVGVAIDGTVKWHEWEANRALAKGLLRYLTDTLATYGYTLEAITGIGVFKGPGSFTGLRIGLTVMNTLADGLHIPIVGCSGATWVDVAMADLDAGRNDRIVLPEYGGDAHITKPRK